VPSGFVPGRVMSARPVLPLASRVRREFRDVAEREQGSRNFNQSRERGSSSSSGKFMARTGAELATTELHIQITIRRIKPAAETLTTQADGGDA